MAKAWPYEEAEKLVRRIEGWDASRPVLFETGYGPSGLPTIATFCEVLRTTMVRNAFTELSDRPTRLIAFSDDLDGMRKVPENVPNRDMLERYLNVSLTRVPDPFGCCESFAHHNNKMLREFLDRFGFEYEFRSATDCYRNDDAFAGALRVFHLNHDAICDIIVPTLGAERAATYSPFMPIDPETGRVFQAKVVGHDINAETLTYLHPDTGEEVTTSILGGACKLQWKADWAMRWFAQEVDYEMAGKDLIESVVLSGRIVRALGVKPPEGFNYEMFLDEEGRKISKSLGNGLTIDEWLTYGPPESLSYYLYREPKKAKKLYAALIPRAIDEYWQARANYATQTLEQRQANPVFHVHGHDVPEGTIPVTFGLLLNLIGILGETDEETVWNYIVRNYAANAGEEIRALIPYALAYHRDHVASEIVRRAPTDSEADALRVLANDLRQLSLTNENPTQEEIQFVVYEVGKATGYAENLRGWFKVVYEIVFGSSEGPRLGAFIAVYGLSEFIELLEDACKEPVNV